MKLYKNIDHINRNSYLRFSGILLSLFFLLFTACIDNSPIKYNSYKINNITPPVDKQGTNSDEKKVYIGHNLPVNVSLTTEYNESDIPLQVYLLNVDDVTDVEDGILPEEDIRMYFCHQTDNTNIEQIEAGTNTYGIVINIPADQSKDEFTDDFKVGTYYVLGEVDKNNEAEMDVYEVYQKFKDNLDEENTIVVASDYMSKPDLSVEDMNFTGTADDPRDSLIFYQLDLSQLPGAESANLGTMYLQPTVSACAFTGSVDIKSSSNDSLNVPVRFYLTHENWADGEEITLEIYDEDMGGFVEEYYIPILRKNTQENINLQLRVPEDSGTINYFSNWDGSTSYTDWENETNKANYPMFRLRYQMARLTADETDGTSEYYKFKLAAEVNPNGSVTESRFIKANSDNTVYTEDDYDETGDEYTETSTGNVLTTANNTFEEVITLAAETVEVKANEGTQFYPCSAIDVNGDNNIDDNDCAYANGERKLVIWWGGWEAGFGSSSFGGTIDAHAGMYFSNYSLLSVGAGINLHIGDFVNPGKGGGFSLDTGYRIDFNAESHPFDAEKSYYEFKILGTWFPFQGFILPAVDVEWGDSEDWWSGYVSFFAFKDSQTGFGEYDIETPVTIAKMEISLDTEAAGMGVEFTIKGGLGGIYIIPRTKMELNRDGSLRYDAGTAVTCGVEAEFGLSAPLNIASVGLEGGIDFFSFDFGIGLFTNAYYNQSTHPGEVRGTLGVGPEIKLTGPQGYLKMYVNLLFNLARIEFPIISFQAIEVTLYEEPFTESEKINWVDVEDADKIDYTVLEKDED
ncbi:MAG: hypothetical protein JW864_17190 [Spirochaetes bacterium]|nr:hypothetical protein [Spirochaetota bacterium]